MRRVFVVVVLAVLSIGAASTLDAECNSYPTNTPTFVAGYGSVCGGYGYGCTECVDSSYNSCVTDGSSCTPHVRHKDV